MSSAIEHSRFEHLRIAPAQPFYEYLYNTRRTQSTGAYPFSSNSLISDALHNVRKSLRASTLSRRGITHVLWHAYRQDEVLQLRMADATMLSQLRSGERSMRSSEHALLHTLQARGWLEPMRPSVELLATPSKFAGWAGAIFPALQNPLELGRFLQLVVEKRPRVVVEIGSARGGVLYSLTQLAATNALIVSIDLPGGDNCDGQSAVERKLFQSMGGADQKIYCLPCNSQYEFTRRLLRRLLNSAPIDLLFIDGDHSYGGVRSDFNMYRELVADDGLIAFHDICIIPEKWGAGNEVGVFWSEVKRDFCHEELIDPDGAQEPMHESVRNSGSRRYAWGIGVLHGAGLRRRDHLQRVEGRR